MKVRGGVRRNGVTVRELAEMVRKSESTIVRKWAEPREEYLARAEQRREAVLRLRREGKTVRAIAEELGVSVGTVHRHIKPARDATGSGA